MKHTSKEYAEKIARELGINNEELNRSAKEYFTEGYIKAVEETNAEGLIEAVRLLEKAQPDTWDYSAARNKLREALKKAII